MKSTDPPRVGKDFDFYGQTAKISKAISEEQVRFNRQQVSSHPSGTTSTALKTEKKPFKTGYEAYQNSGHIPDLRANASLWGTGPEASSNARAPQQRGADNIPAKMMMSLEEVEASMRARSKKPSPSQAIQQQTPIPPPVSTQPQPLPQQVTYPLSSASAESQHQQQPIHQIPRALHASQVELPTQTSMTSHVSPAIQQNYPQILHRESPLPPQGVGSPEPAQPRRILQNTKRQQAQLAPRPPEPPLASQVQQQIANSGHLNISSHLPLISNPQQLTHLTQEDRTALLIEDAKRAKRNHKIYLLSKDNGLMTPQDKNFVTRIQLQQLMTATGNVNEQDPDAALSEDFYYQVHSQIRGGPRQTPHQPLSNFAQTYLFQTGSRQGSMARRQNRAGDNYMQRMEQQVLRAVEAAKLRPKNKQLVPEGSLGKITFSNAKTPKPLLNIKRHDNGDAFRKSQSADRQGGNKKIPSNTTSTSDRKTILKNIEEVYTTLMKLEDHERLLQPVPTDGSETTLVMQQQNVMQNLIVKLWDDLKIMEPYIPDSTVLHPFIAFLSHPKGKKSIPRVFRHIDQNQRLTILTMIVVHLNVLDVIRKAQPQPNLAQPPIAVREEVELFCQAVAPSLFAYINEAPLDPVMGLMGLILDRINVKAIVRTKVGLNILTMLISRAEIVRQGESLDAKEWNDWLDIYNRLFNTIEPLLGDIFPSSINAGQDEYVWRFLAACGIGASPEQQRRLVVAVKYECSLFVINIDYLLIRVLLGIGSWKPLHKARLYRLKWHLKSLVMLIFSCGH